MSLKRRTLALVTGVMLTLSLAGAASAHEHRVARNGQVLANWQLHGAFDANGVSCGGDPAGYGLESAHHGPDAGIPGKADGDGCYQTTDGVAPRFDVENPAIN